MSNTFEGAIGACPIDGTLCKKLGKAKRCSKTKADCCTNSSNTPDIVKQLLKATGACECGPDCDC